MRVVYYCILLALFSIKSVHSHNPENELTADIQAYCQYITEKNNAKKSLLLSPDVVVRAQNSNNDYPYQNNLISALSKDLSDIGKSNQLKQLINDECNYYKLTQEASLQIQFAIPNAQKKAQHFKLQQINSAKNKLNALLKTIQKKIDSQNETLTSFYKVDSSLQKLDEAEREIQVNLAIQQPPDIVTIKLKDLLNQIWTAEKKRKLTRNKLEKLQNWSVQIQAGGQQSFSSFTHNKTIQPYAALFLRYNLGSIPSNDKKDKSLNHYMDWKNKQVNGTQKQLSRLIRSVALLKSVEEQRLNRLKVHYNKYYGLTKKLSAVNSFKASRFKQQIKIDRIMMDIEIKYLEYFTQRLNEIS